MHSPSLLLPVHSCPTLSHAFIPHMPQPRFPPLSKAPHPYQYTSLLMQHTEAVVQAVSHWLWQNNAMEYSLWPVWVSCPGSAPSHALVHRQPTWETENALKLCKHCSATAKPLLCYQTVSATNPKHSIMQPAMKDADSIPARHSTIYLQWCFLHNVIQTSCNLY